MPSSIATAGPSSTIDHLRLISVDARKIRIFLIHFDQYERKIHARASQLNYDEKQRDSIRPVNLKLCLDLELLDSALAVGYLPTAEKYEDVDDKELCVFLENETQKRRTTISTTNVDGIVDSELRTEINVRSTATQMKVLFVWYNTLLRRSGMRWVLKEKPKIWVSDVLRALRPQLFRQGIKTDLELPYHKMKKYFNVLMAHTL